VDKERDICKAFDTVSHNIFVAKLERHDFERWSTRCQRNWLDGCIQRVSINGSLSKYKSVMSGVSQEKI